MIIITIKVFETSYTSLFFLFTLLVKSGGVIDNIDKQRCFLRIAAGDQRRSAQSGHTKTIIDNLRKINIHDTFHVLIDGLAT